MPVTRSYPILHVALFIFSVFMLTASAGTTRVSCVGNSVTSGSNIIDITKRYPGRLQSLLGDEYSVSRNGVGGACLMKSCDLPYWKSGLPGVFEINPHIIFIMLGTNDSKIDNAPLLAADFVKDMKAMVDTFQLIGILIFSVAFGRYKNILDRCSIFPVTITL